MVFVYLKNKPEDANWLTPEEKARLRDHLEHDVQAVAAASHGSLFALIRDPKVMFMALTHGLGLGAVYAMVFWMPTLVQSWGIADVFHVGMLTAIPAVCGVIGMVLFGRSSDKHNERRLHYLACTAFGLSGAVIVAVAQGNIVASLFGLVMIFICQSASVPILFAGVSEYLPRKTVAAGIALVSSLGNLLPLFMPWVTTRINNISGSPSASLYLLGVMWISAGIVLMLVLRPANDRPILQSMA